ncbi:MAG: RNA-binding domain-containing protein [Candidatus Heimdallarchaeota archaeon]
MLKITNISLTVFGYMTEEVDRIEQIIKNILPFEISNDNFTHIKSFSQFGDKFSIMNYETENYDEVNQIMEDIGKNMSKTEKVKIKGKLKKLIDLDEKKIYFRLNKFDLYNNEIIFDEGNDVLKIEISYNTYNKNENNYDKIENLFKLNEWIN